MPKKEYETIRIWFEHLLRIKPDTEMVARSKQRKEPEAKAKLDAIKR